jgi:hypothetical protein
MHSFIFAAVRPCPHRPGVASGRLTNGAALDDQRLDQSVGLFQRPGYLVGFRIAGTVVQNRCNFCHLNWQLDLLLTSALSSEVSLDSLADSSSLHCLPEIASRGG